MAAPSTYIFAGGGTGGHLFPGIAVAQELRRRDPSVFVVFVGSTRAIECEIVARHGLEHRPLPVEPLPTLSRNPLKFAWRNWKALRTANQLLRELRPTAVIGLGGFASAPIIWAASRHRIPVILLEQNVIPGRTTRWLSPFARHVCVTFEESRSRLPRHTNVVVTGNPVRTEIVSLHAMSPDDSNQIPASIIRPELLILGGSQGADSLNQAVLTAVEATRELFQGWTVVHQTGPRQIDAVRQTYKRLGIEAIVEPFFNDMPRRYSTASLAISRAGATTLAELACAGVATILLPYPFAADNHQHANAEVFVKHLSAILVEHGSPPERTSDALANALRQLIADPQRRRVMGLAAKDLAHPDAACQIADLIAKNSVQRP